MRVFGHAEDGSGRPRLAAFEDVWHQGLFCLRFVRISSKGGATSIIIYIYIYNDIYVYVFIIIIYIYIYRLYLGNEHPFMN